MKLELTLMLKEICKLEMTFDDIKELDVTIIDNDDE